MRKIYLPVVWVLLVGSCSTGRIAPTSTGGRSETGRPALYAIHNSELHELMAKMDSLMQERFMTETQLDSERRKFSQRIADSALGLSKTVDAIIAKMSGLSLSPQEQTTFLALAGKLHQETEQLHDLASRNRIDAIDDTLHQINTTCISCHALFRKIGN